MSRDNIHEMKTKSLDMRKSFLDSTEEKNQSVWRQIIESIFFKGKHREKKTKKFNKTSEVCGLLSGL